MTSRLDYPPAVPSRYNPDSSPADCVGNNLICIIEPPTPIYQGLMAVYDSLAAHPTISKKIHLMPPESWHMTMLNCVDNNNREAGWWPQGKEQQPLDECTRDFGCRLRLLDNQLGRECLNPPYRIRGTGFDADSGFGVGLCVGAVDSDEDKRLRRLRNLLAETIGFREPGHDSYAFHVTIAYYIRYVDGEEKVELDALLAEVLPQVRICFDLDRVAFCDYRNLNMFSRQFYIGRDMND